MADFNAVYEALGQMLQTGLKMRVAQKRYLKYGTREASGEAMRLESLFDEALRMCGVVYKQKGEIYERGALW